MTKSNATDKQLGELHGKLAKAMLKALNASDEAVFLLDEHGADLPTPVYQYLEKQAGANPALLTAVTKFLKDNSITCAVEDSTEMTDLQQRLSDKKRRRVGNVIPIEE